MSKKILNANKRIAYQLSIGVSAEEIDVIDRKCRELGLKTRADFLREAVENLIGEKIFRRRIYDKK